MNVGILVTLQMVALLVCWRHARFFRLLNMFVEYGVND